MKTTKLIIAMASMMMLASCGGNTPASSSVNSSVESSVNSSVESSVSSQAEKKTMAFLQDGQFYADIPTDVLTPVEGHVPAIKVNGISINGSRTGQIGDKIELVAEGEFAKDVYVVVAKSESEGHISARVYGALEKGRLSEALPVVAEAIGKPNKVFISFTVTKNSWPKKLDEEMDREIEAAWGLLGE